MDDVNDAEDELGGSEPEIGSGSLPNDIDLEFYRKRSSLLKPKLESALPNNSEDQKLVPDINVPEDGCDIEEDMTAGAGVTVEAEQPPETILPETVYVDTSAPTFHYFSDGEADRSDQPQRPGTPGVVSVFSASYAASLWCLMSLTLTVLQVSFQSKLYHEKRVKEIFLANYVETNGSTGSN